MPPEPRRLLERFPAELLHCCGALLLQRFHRIPTLPSLLPMTAPTLISAHLRQVGRAYARLQRSIAQRLRVSLSRRRTRAAACVGLLGLAFGGAALALVAGPNLRNYSSEVTVVRMPVETPDLAEEIRSAVRIGDYRPIHVVAQPGETLLSLFSRLGVKDQEAYEFIAASPKAAPLWMPQTGQYVTMGVAPDGKLVYMRLFMEGPYDRDNRTVEVMRVGGNFAISILPYNFTTSETLISGTVEKTLWETARSLDIPESIMEQLEAVWDRADNPLREMKPGDTLRLVYEKKFADGRFVRDGQLLAVQIVEDGRRVTTPQVHEAFWFSDGVHAGSYYALDGRSASQTFMRVPLDVKDISSEFAPLRRHPITGVLRSHNGTDMRAPSGSHIFAAADGRIERVAYEARGYGHYVVIDHGLGRKTLYAHMRKVAKGIRSGMRVKKGQVIGFVGMTGLATGPHLHYELMIDGVQINPRTADLPDTENLSPYQLAQLRAQTADIQARFEEAAEREGKPSPGRMLAGQMKREAEEDAEQARNALESASADKALEAKPNGGAVRNVSIEKDAARGRARQLETARGN